MTQTSPATLLGRRFPAKRVFITGAASGLGLALARLFARDGWSLGLLDVSQARLEEAAAQLRDLGARDVTACCGDVADAEFVAQSLHSFAAARGGALDVLVNNAGVAVAGGVDVTPAADWEWIVRINLLGVVWGCRAGIPLLRAQGGLIFNVASSAGFAAAPQMAAYNATKAAVIALSETLVGELAGSGIQVSVAMPGFFRTHLLDQMRAPAAEERVAHQLMDHSRYDADAAALALLCAAARGDTYIVWPREYRLAWRLKRWFPRWFLKRVQAFRDAQLRRADRPRG